MAGRRWRRPSGTGSPGLAAAAVEVRVLLRELSPSTVGGGSTETHLGKVSPLGFGTGSVLLFRNERNLATGGHRLRSRRGRRRPGSCLLSADTKK